MSKRLGERTWDVPHPRTEDISLDALIERLRAVKQSLPAETFPYTLSATIKPLIDEAVDALTALRDSLKATEWMLDQDRITLNAQIASLKAENERQAAEQGVITKCLKIILPPKPRPRKRHLSADEAER